VKKVTAKMTGLKMLLLSSLIFSCNRYDTSALYTYHPPENKNYEIEAGSLESANIDERMISKAVIRICRGKYK